MTFFWTLLSKLLLGLLSLRYRIRVKGQEHLRELEKRRSKGGILFLPNHTAHMDPLILFLLIWPKYRMRPLVAESIYRLSFLKPFMTLVKALPIPSFESSVNQLKIKKAKQSMQAIAQGLKEGQNYILNPSGKLKTSGREVLGGSSAAHNLVQECPEARLVLIRTTGFWGSRFSRALLGRSPDLFRTLMQGVKIALKNGIFFCPRRPIEIEIALEPADFPRKGSRIEFNRYLERWYNRYLDAQGKMCDVEPLRLYSYAFWKQDIPEVALPKKKGTGAGPEVAISSATRSKIYAEIRKVLDNPGMEIRPEMSLAFDLGMDSLNSAEMIAFLAQEFDVEEVHPEDVQTVQDVLEIAERERISERSLEEGGIFYWPEEASRPAPALPQGRTIPEAFLHSAQRMGKAVVCGDDLVGVLRYPRFKRAVLVLAAHFRSFSDERIGVLLPASVGAYLVIFALQMAGKIPVMLNWTLGPRYLDEMMRLSGAKVAISSWRFLEKLSHVEFGSLVDQIHLLEEIRESLSWRKKLSGLFLSLLSPSVLLRTLRLNQIDENSPCVILFTSGTEASPKGVPLSHKNIIANQRSAMQCISLNEKDVLYGILPPFHSFGFSVAGLFPLLSGIKVAFYPDPTDSFALAEGIKRWKITLFCSAPNFLKGLLNAAKLEQLASVRFFISGAEKAPPELYDRIGKLGTGAKLIEGYGITECAPILTLTRLNLPPRGTGKPLPDVEVCTIHPETEELLPVGREGEICVRGPNVFHGYLGNPRTPFIEIQGKKWYRTGDIGFLDAEGNLILSGRLKRFTKLGGEMISLGAVEAALIEALLKQARASSDQTPIALIADEREGAKARLILFTTLTLEKEEANELLQQAGFSRLVKISSVQKIEEIPMMGTGKTDYRKLQQRVV